MAASAQEAQPSPGGDTEKTASPQHVPCTSPGNPVFSCMLEPTTLTTGTCFAKPQLLLYKTTSSDYGAVPPTPPTVPCRYHPRDNSLTDHLFACGKTQYNNINTGLDKSKVCGDPSL